VRRARRRPGCAAPAGGSHGAELNAAPPQLTAP
jgi:hypothetical protein